MRQQPAIKWEEQAYSCYLVLGRYWAGNDDLLLHKAGQGPHPCHWSHGANPNRKTAWATCTDEAGHERQNLGG